MDFRRVAVSGLIFSMLFVIGCRENNNQNYINEETTEDTITEKHFHSEYIWTEIDKSVRILDSNQTRGFDPDTSYVRIRVELAPLFDEEDITRIEYHIDDGNGYFMDKAEFMTMKVDEMEKRVNTLTQWDENGYHCAPEDQQDIYFTIYNKHDINLDQQQQRISNVNLIRKLSIVVDVKYSDGSEKQHRYAFDYSYTDNFTNGKIYELTKE